MSILFTQASVILGTILQGEYYYPSFYVGENESLKMSTCAKLQFETVETGFRLSSGNLQLGGSFLCQAIIRDTLKCIHSIHRGRPGAGC